MILELSTDYDLYFQMLSRHIASGESWQDGHGKQPLVRQVPALMSFRTGSTFKN